MGRCTFDVTVSLDERRDIPARENLFDPIGDLLAADGCFKFLSRRGGGLSSALVNDWIKGLDSGLADARSKEKRFEQTPIRHSRDDVGTCESKRAHHIESDCEKLRIGSDAFFPHDVCIQLKMLAEPSPLLFFLTKQLRNGKPPNGFAQRIRASRDHSCKCRSHFRTQRNFALAPVLEGIDLPD